MATFNGQGLTTTGDDPNQPVNLGADSVIPDLGSLIVTGDGMSGQTPFNFVTINGGTITGVDCKLIRGDVFHEVVQAADSAVDKGNVTEEVQGNFAETVQGTYTENVTGLYTLTVTGGWNEEQQGAVNRHYFMVVTDTFDQDHQQHVPDSSDWVNTKYQKTFVGIEQLGIVGVFQLAMVLGICLTVETAVDLEAKALHTELHGIHFANNVAEGKIVDANAIALKPLSEYIGAALKAWIAANAGIDWDSIRPLA